MRTGNGRRRRRGATYMRWINGDEQSFTAQSIH